MYAPLYTCQPIPLHTIFFYMMKKMNKNEKGVRVRYSHFCRVQTLFCALTLLFIAIWIVSFRIFTPNFQ